MSPGDATHNVPIVHGHEDDRLPELDRSVYNHGPGLSVSVRQSYTFWRDVEFSLHRVGTNLVTA